MARSTRAPWLETERQGHGRRYWFRTAQQGLQFAKAKHAAGYLTVTDDHADTVWVSFAKRSTRNKARQAQHAAYGAGVDPLAGRELYGD